MIHQYKLNGYNIVLDVFSGSVHCVDELAYDVIEMFENNSRDDIVSDMLKNTLTITKSQSRKLMTA